MSAQTIRQSLIGTSWRTVAAAYQTAIDRHDLIAQRVIEGFFGRDGSPIDIRRPDDVDIEALFTLTTRTIGTEKKRRHPAAARTVREQTAAVKNDPVYRGQQTMRLATTTPLHMRAVA